MAIWGYFEPFSEVLEPLDGNVGKEKRFQHIGPGVTWLDPTLIHLDPAIWGLQGRLWPNFPNLLHFGAILSPSGAPPLGRGPRQKNGKILTELSFFAVFNHKNDLEKVWKSRNEFKLVGFKVEKNGPCSREN